MSVVDGSQVALNHQSTSDNKQQHQQDTADDKFVDNTQSTMRTEETTKPSETEQSKDEESNALFDKADEFEQRLLENTNLINDDIILSEDQIHSAHSQSQNAPQIQDNEEDKRASPQLIDYGDYYSDLPPPSKSQNLMNIEPSDELIDKESQELIDKLLAEDQQAMLNAEQQSKAASTSQGQQQIMTTSQNQQKFDKFKSQYFSANSNNPQLDKQKQQQESSGNDPKEMFTDLTSKFKEKLSGMFNNTSSKKSMGLSQQEQLVNQQFLQESLMQMKQNKKRSFQEKIADEAGAVEEWIFLHPRCQGSSSSDQELLVQFDLFKDLQQPCGDADKYEEDVMQIDSSSNRNYKWNRLEKFKRSGIQIHNRKYLKNKNGQQQAIDPSQMAQAMKFQDQNQLEFGPQEGSPKSSPNNFSISLKNEISWQPESSPSGSSQEFQVISSDKDEDADSFKEKGEQAVQKMKDNAAEAKKKMQEAGKRFSEKFSTFF